MAEKFPVERRAALIDPDRSRVLGPDKIISLLPIEPDHAVMDVGCGNGFFSFPLAGYLARGRLYAVDMQDRMLQDIRDRIATESIGNIEVVLSRESDIPLPKAGLNGVFSAFMFHETQDQAGFLRLLKGLLKPGGWLAVLEWHKREMESGPPVSERIAEEKCLSLLEEVGFMPAPRPYLSEEHYVFIVRRPAL